MSKKENVDVSGYIKLTERHYLKPCEAAREKFDLYELRDTVESKKYANKLEDIAFGLSLESAIEKVIYIEGFEGTKDLQKFLEKIKQIQVEIRQNIIDYLN